MDQKDQKDLDIESLEVNELEDQDLEDVAGGVADTINYGCPNNNCGVLE